MSSDSESAGPSGQGQKCKVKTFYSHESDISGASDDSVERGGERGRPRVRRKVFDKKGRSRTRHMWMWAQDVAKQKKNLGQEYHSAKTKKLMAAKELGPPCADGCFEKVGLANVQEIFNNFSALGNYNTQMAHLTSLILDAPVKRKRTQETVSTRKNNTYTVKHRKTYSVCRNAFKSMHGIKERTLLVVLSKKHEAVTGTPERDRRGKRPIVRKIEGLKLQRVHEHIRSLPARSSHYSRSKSPHHKYLEAGGTIKGLHGRYCVWMNDNHIDEEMVSERFYRTIFTTCYNILFETPKQDTCTTCDTLNVKINIAKESKMPTDAFDRVMEEHLKKKNAVQDLLRQCEGREDDNVQTIAMDLQQTLPVPQLSAGIAYFLQKLWVYNFCIYDVNRSKATMFVWDEVTAGRGSDEIASCIMHWVNTRQREGADFTTLRIFCDNCAGQNKNINIVLAALRMVHEQILARVEVIFMVSGHSFLPCDRAFGNIELKIKETGIVHQPKDYLCLIKYAVSPPFEVVAMEREIFFDVKDLQNYITNRLTKGLFKNACQLVITSGYGEGYIIKNDYVLEDSVTNVTKVRLMKGHAKYNRKAFNFANVSLKQKYPEERLLSTVKIADLQKVIPLIGEGSARWLTDLIERQKAMQAAGNPVLNDGDDDGDELDIDNDQLDYDAVTAINVQ